jgi:hypothetical protein
MVFVKEVQMKVDKLHNSRRRIELGLELKWSIIRGSRRRVGWVNSHFAPLRLQRKSAYSHCHFGKVLDSKWVEA